MVCTSGIGKGELVLMIVDQQLGQMYELMQAIRKRELEDSESES